jgi:hypothetical protein
MRGGSRGSDGHGAARAREAIRGVPGRGPELPLLGGSAGGRRSSRGGQPEHGGERGRRHLDRSRPWGGDWGRGGQSRDWRGDRRRNRSSGWYCDRGQRRLGDGLGSPATLRHRLSTVHVRQWQPDSRLRLPANGAASTPAAAEGQRICSPGTYICAAPATRRAFTRSETAFLASDPASAVPELPADPAIAPRTPTRDVAVCAPPFRFR